MDSVLILDNHTLEKFVTYYNNYKIETNDNRILYSFKNDDFSITIYNSKKVVFQGANGLHEYNKWALLLGKETIDETKENNNNYLNQYYAKKVIGSDEVGTGDFFGPIVVCAAFVTPKDYHLLQELNINDSKKITDERIRKIAPRLIENIPHHILVLNNEKYNLLIQQDYNMNKIKAYLHNHAIKKMVGKDLKYDFVILDQFCSKENYFEYLKSEETFKNIVFITKAETVHMAVAVASIIARYKFLLEMDGIEQKLGMSIPKGASAAVDAIGQVVKLKYGNKIFNEIAKLNFKNSERIGI